MVLYLSPSHNCGELFPYIFATFFRINLVPLSALQVLAIDLGLRRAAGFGAWDGGGRAGHHVAPAATATREASRPGVAEAADLPRCHPVGRGDGGVPARILAHGWHWGVAINPGDAMYPIYREAITATQGAIVVSQFVNGFVCRTERASLWRVGLLSENLGLVAAEFMGLIILCAISYVPFLEKVFNTAPLSGSDWAVLWGFAGLLFIAEEGRKALVRLRASRPARGG